MKTLLGTLLLLAAVVLAAWAVLFRGGPAAPAGPPPPGPRPVPVTLVPVEQGRVAETLELVGDVVSARRSPVAFRRAGQIAEVAVELGDRVEAGRLLARLEDSVLAEQEAAAAAALAAAEADAA
ncbi:MAG: biotin/lipoyl-binding protein, partial [Planctomycetota bacterium]